MKEEDLRSILRRTNIPYRGRKSAKGWIAFPCPLGPWFHKSGRINPKQFDAAALVDPNGPSVWKCQSCHNSGPVHSLVRMVTRYRDGKADEALAEDAEKAEIGAMLTVPDWDAPVETKEMLGQPLDEDLYDGTYPLAIESEAALDYLGMRGIGYITAEKLGLMFDPDENRVLFPVRDNNKGLYGYTGRDITGEARLKVKDYLGLPKRHLILGEDRWRPNTPKLIVEGLFGYAHLIEIGAEALVDVGAVLGSAMTEEKAARLKAHGDMTILLFDNDEAGEAGLFGPVSKDTGVRDETRGAIAQLVEHIPIIVPAWPTYANDVELADGTFIPAGTAKVDPDEITLDDIRSFLTSWPYSKPKKFKPRG